MKWLYEKKSPIGVSGDRTLNFLCSNDNLFVMDNHLAALWCWENFLKVNPAHIVHVDYHNDCIDDGQITPTEISLIKTLSIEDYIAKLSNNGMPMYKWDNYLLQYSKAYPACGFTIHTHGEPDEVPGNTIVPLWKILEMDLSRSQSIIYNLDIDVFFTGDEDPVGIYSDRYISKYSQSLANIIENKSNCITIALSPDCCGGWGQMLSLFQKVNSEASLGFDELIDKIFLHKESFGNYW